MTPAVAEDGGFIFYSHTGQRICHIAIRTDRRVCELSYGTEREFWGKGYMQEALKTVLQLFKENHVIDEISGLICENPVSAHILEKLGFVKGEQYQGKAFWYIYKGLGEKE